MAVTSKIVKGGQDYKKPFNIGRKLLAAHVISTLGPFGENFFLEKGNRVTTDGVTVARAVSSKDELEDRGVIHYREAAIKQNDEVGEGTTTVIALQDAIADAIADLTGKGTTIANKLPRVDLLAKIETERQEIDQKLVEMSKPITSEEEMVQSAIVSVENKELGELIGKAQWKLGKDGFLIAEEVNDRECSVEYVNGVRIDNGFSTSLSVNNKEKESLEVSEVSVLLSNYVFSDSVGLEPIVPVLKQIYQMGVRDVVIFGRAFSIAAFQHMKREADLGFRLYPMNAPYQDQAEIMKDLEAVLGGTFINSEEVNIENMQVSDFGLAEKIVARRYDATITGKVDEKSKERIGLRIKELQAQLKGSKSEFEKKTLSARISQLTTGFGIVKIGAVSEKERGYRKDKADDAVNAVRWAIQEGVVPGAGLAFKLIADSLPDTYILKKPLLSIYSQIKSTAPAGWTVPEWVKDPTRVLRSALKYACSGASTGATIGGGDATEREKPRYVQEANKPTDAQA